VIENDYKMMGFHSQALLRHLHCSVCALPKQCQYIFNVQGHREQETVSVGGGQGGGRCTGNGRRGAGSGRKREKLCNIVQSFAIAKMQRGGSQQIQGGNWD